MNQDEARRVQARLFQEGGPRIVFGLAAGTSSKVVPFSKEGRVPALRLQRFTKLRPITILLPVCCPLYCAIVTVFRFSFERLPACFPIDSYTQLLSSFQRAHCPRNSSDCGDSRATFASSTPSATAMPDTTKVVPLTCHGHSRPVPHIHFSALQDEEQYYIISACKDGNPMLRDGLTGDWIGTFLGHKGAVWQARLSSDASLAATASADFSAYVLPSGVPPREFTC